MARQDIDIGIQGNDGTGDSIRDSFRKVNENFQEVYAVFGAGGTINFTALGDTPNSYINNQIFITNDAGTAILAKTLVGVGGVTIDQTSTPGTIKLVGSQSNLFADGAPRLGGPLNVNNLAVANIPDPSDSLVASFNSTYASLGISTTIGKLAISKGYADSHYVGKGDGNTVIGALNIRTEPLSPELTDPNYDATLTGNFLATEALPRKATVYRGGDTMLGKLTLSDHPAPVAGFGTPNSADDKQAATKFYVDNEVFVSSTNLYVRTDGDDTQLKTPPGREGRNWAHAYKTISAAALQAETLQALANLETGPYRQKISYTITPNTYTSTVSTVGLTGGNSAVQGYVDAAALLTANKTFIQAETIAYINNKYVNAFTYDQVRYQSDIGSILTAVGNDLVVGTNFNSVQFATSYFAKQNSEIINSQLIQTIDAINYAREQVLAFAYSSTALTTYLNTVIDALNYDMTLNSNYQSLTAARYFPDAGTGLSVTEIVGAFGQLKLELANLAKINGLTVDLAVTRYNNNLNSMITVVQGGLEPAVSMVETSASTTAKKSARTLLLNNISFVQAEIVAWLAANYPKLAYSQTSCKRDVQYIIEAVAYDQLYDGNSRTIYAGQRYWANAIRQIAYSELAATKGAYTYLKTLLQAVVGNSTPATVYQNSVIQYQNQTYTGGSARAATISNLVSLISGTAVAVTATNSSTGITTPSSANLTLGMVVTIDNTSSITVTGFSSKSGAGPYLVNLVIPTQTSVPITNSSFTVAGNSNTSYNGTFTVNSATSSSVVLNYPTDPGVYGGGTTTITPYFGGLTPGGTYYVIEIADTTHFKVSSTQGGTAASLTNTQLATNITWAGLLTIDSPPANTPPTYNAGSAPLPTVYGNVTSTKATAVTNVITFINNTYPYISNVTAITQINSLFQVMTDILSGSLANRTVVTIVKPASTPSINFSASQVLLLNRTFIAAEVLGWIKQNYASLSYVDSDGQIQWEKDIQTFVEAVAYDLTYTGLSGSAFAANQFWTSAVVNGSTVYTSTIDASEKAAKVASIGYAQSISAYIIGNNAPVGLYQSQLPKTATYVSKSGTAPNVLVTVLIPTRIIPIAVGSNVTVQGNSTVAYNGTFVVSASTASSVTLVYPTDPGTWSIATTTFFSIAQVTSGIYVDGASAVTAMNAKWDRLVNVVDSNPPNLVTTSPDLTDSSYASTGYVAVRNVIVANSLTVAQATTTYLNSKYKGGFAYNEATCRRDIGYIVDAMSIDLLTGGTYQSINAGKSYYRNASAKAVAIGTQNVETIDGIKYARTLSLQVLNQTVATRYQTLVTQVTDASKNANQGYSATATYSSASTVTLNVTGVSGTIKVGMTVTGTGFTGGQIVTAVIGGQLTLSAAANDIITGTPTLTFTLTAITTFTNNYATMLSIVQNGIGVAPTPDFGTGIYTIRFTNGGNGFVDQCPPGDFNILPGKLLKGVNSNATANILSYVPGSVTGSNLDTITCQLLQPGFFVTSEELEYAESVGANQIVIFVESGVYEEDYPIRLTSAVSIKGDEFRRTIVRPKDRVSQSPWRKLFFYRDSVIDGMQIGPIDDSADYVPTTIITSFSSKTSAGSGAYDVVFNIPTQTYIPSTAITYTVSGNTNLSYNGTFTCTASSTTQITLRYPSDPGSFSIATLSSITPLTTATISGTSGKIIITLSSNQQASVSYLGYVFQSDLLDSNGKPGRAYVDSVSGNFMNCTVMYPFTQTGLASINYTNAYTFTIGETVTQSGTSSSATGVVISATTTTLTYKVTSGIMSTTNGAITGATSGAQASVSAISFGVLAPTSWHLYQTKNYGRHYLTDPSDVNSTPKNNKDCDVFLCADAVRVNNLSIQGHGGFSMVLDPEGQIKSKSPYGQVATSFSRSQNKQVFAGGQFVDGFTGRLFGQITNASADGYTLIVTGGLNSGLDVRAPQTPTAFFVRGGRYQVNTVSNYSQTFDVNGNVIGGSVQLNLGAQTPWLGGAGQNINIEMAGNKSMLANDFAMINDLGYAILATNGGITEQVSTFTYYCWTSFWSLNGGQIRSVGSSSAHGQYALRATGYDVTEKPDSVSLAQNLAQTARIFNPTTLPQSSTGNQFYGNMNTTGISVYVYAYDYFPTQITELEIDHTLAGKGIVRYQINSVSHTTVYVPTGSIGSNFSFTTATFASGSTASTTMTVNSNANIKVGQTVTGTGFTRRQQITATSLDGITVTLNGAPDSTPSGTLYFSDTITVGGAGLGGVSSTFSANTSNNLNYLSSVGTLAAVRPSPALLILGYLSKTGTGPYLVTFEIPGQASSPSLTSGYVVSGNTNTSYNGSYTATASTTGTITLSYASDPGVFSSTNYTVIMPPSTTAATYLTKTGSAPNVRITFTITAVTTLPLVGGSFTIAGNGNASYNGTFICVGSTLTSITLRYTTDPGASSGSATTYNFNGATIIGPNLPFGTTALATTGGNTVILSNNATATGSGLTFSSNAGNDLTAYVTGLVNTAVSTFTYTGNAVPGGSATYSNLYQTLSSSIGVYANFNITVTPNFGGGTVGTIAGSGTQGAPWTATITGMTSTTGMIIGNTLSATAGTGTLFGGTPTTVVITSIASGTSITYAVVGGTTPTAGTVTSIITASAYTSAVIGGQNVLLLTLSTSGSGGTSSTGLAAPLYDNQLIQLRVLQNFKFYEIDNVNPTRPSTAVQFTDNLGSIYRVLSYNLTEATNEILPANQAILSSDQSFAYYLFQADTGNITRTDPIDGGTKTMGATPGDTRIAVTLFGPQSSIDQINKGTYAFAFGGKVHAISSYTAPITTTILTGYNPTGSAGTTLVLGGIFTGTVTSSSSTITFVSSFTGLVVGESIIGFGIPAGTTIISTNTGTSTIGLSAAATATGSGVSFIYGSIGQPGAAASITTGMVVSGVGFTTGQSVLTITSNTIASFVIADSAGTITVTSSTYVVGEAITISGTFGGAGSLVVGGTTYSSASTSNMTAGVIFYVGRVNSGTSIQLSSTYANAIATSPVFITSTTGTPTGLTYSRVSNTVVLSAGPSSTPSGSLTFTKATVPYITLGATKYSITSTSSSPITITRPQSVGQVAGTYVPTGNFTGNITSASTSILGVSSLTGISAGSSIVCTGIPGQVVVTAVSTTSPSTINLGDASALAVGNLITFDPTQTTFGGIPVAGALYASSTFAGSGATGLSVTSAATYTAVPVKSSNGVGTGATFTIVKSGAGTAYASNVTITLVYGGAGYAVGNTITISGVHLGGTDITNDMTFTVAGAVYQASYYVRTISTNAITIAATLGGTAITGISTVAATSTIASFAFADSAGTATVTSGTYTVGQAITITGSFSAGAISGYTTGTTYYIGKVNSATSIQITSSFTKATASTPVFDLSTSVGTATPGATFTLTQSTISARTDNPVVSTSSTTAFTGTPTNGSATLASISSFTNLVVGAPISGAGVAPGSTIISLNTGASTITMSNQAIGSPGASTITCTTNTVVLSAPATATANAQYITYNNLSTSILVYTSDRTQFIKAGMSVFGNGFTGGQTVISATASTSGAPTTTIVLSAAPNTTPFGVVGFTELSSTTTPFYITLQTPVQGTAPVVDTFYLVSGNGNSDYNKFVQCIASTTTSITLAYQTDPQSTLVTTYNPTGSLVSISAGLTIRVASSTGINIGDVIRGGGTGGFYAGQTVTGINADGVTLTVSGNPAGTPSGNLNFTAPFQLVSATTITPIITGISRPMNSTVAQPLRAGYLAGASAQITTRISTCRVTAHDLLDIGTGGYNTTNYPYQIYGNPYQKADQTSEVLEETVGRVFYVTTDQNGIFRVGRFFTVDQGTGTVTFSASIALSNLDGLGFKRGVTVSEFSTDSSMTNDASDTVPTQSAVRGYIDNRLGVQHSGATTPATALIGSGYLNLSGQLPMKGNMSMGGFTIGSMGLPILQTDATSKLYVDNVINARDSFYKLKDTAASMQFNTVQSQIAVWGFTNSNNNGQTGAWTNASFASTSDLTINWNGTTLTSTIQGAVVATTYVSGGTAGSGSFTGTISGNVLTVTGSPSVTVVKGMILTGGTVSAGTYIIDTGLTTTSVNGTGGAGTYIINSSQTATCTGGTVFLLTLNSSTGIVPGMIISGTGYTGSQFVTGITNTTVVTMSAVYNSGPSGRLTFTRNGSVDNNKVSATAAIAQSKLAMQLTTATISTVPTLTTVNAGSFVVGKRYRISSAGTTTNWTVPGTALWAGASAGTVGTIFQAFTVGGGDGQAIDMDALQGAAGVSQYDSTQFTVTDGWVTVKTATDNSTGIPASKITWIAGNSVLSNINGTVGAVAVNTTQAMVANGDGIRNQDIPATGTTTTLPSGNTAAANSATTGAVIRSGVKAYGVIGVTTTGGNYSLVQTDSNGVIDVKGIKINSLPTSGNIFAISTTTLEFYTPGNIKFMQSVGASTATNTFYGLNDFSQTGATLQSKTLTTGASGTAGSIVGQWAISASSQFDTTLGTLKSTSITTGADATGGTLQGTWTLVGASKLQATYADIAEYYEGDQEYEPGTVLVFGGEKEVTTTGEMNDTRSAGVVTTNPAYTMNEGQTGLRVCIALAGRVPCKVVGRVKKGDMLTTSSTPGYAVKATDPKLGSIIGKALEDKDNGEAGVIQVAVGRV
jgi:hypothetical protein